MLDVSDYWTVALHDSCGTVASDTSAHVTLTRGGPGCDRVHCAGKRRTHSWLRQSIHGILLECE